MKWYNLIIFLTLFLVGYGQTNMSYEKFDKIKVREAKSLVKKYHGKLIKDLCKEFDTEVYSLSNGQALVIYDTHAFLHKSLQNIYKFNEASKERAGEVKHILEGKFSYQQAQFLEQKDTIIHHFLNRISIPISIPLKLESLKNIDSALIQKLKGIYEPDLYISGFIAVIGECIKNEVHGSDWIIINKGGTKVWEPYIKDDKDVMYNPFLIAYKDLYEYFPEQGNISSYDHTVIEIKMPITPIIGR